MRRFKAAGVYFLIFASMAACSLSASVPSTSLPVVIGSGMTPENIRDYLPLADGFIVGSTFRRDGKFLEVLEPRRLDRFMKVFRPERKRILDPQ